METINSVFDGITGLSVEEMLSNPAYLPEKVLKTLDGREAQKLFFRTETVKSNVVAYREALAPELEDAMGPVSEFGTIPVSDPLDTPFNTLAVGKKGVGIRVSWEQREDDERDQVKNELIARTNTILRSKAREALDALDAAELQELSAAVAWDQQGATPASDILDAIELVTGAEDGEGHYYEYVPTVLWIHPTTLTALKRNEEVQNLYTGDMASENPLFKGVSDEPLLFGQLQVAKSFYVPKGTAYLGIEGAGFMAEREPMKITDFYAERGDSELGGATMSWRSDVSHRRGFGIDNPKGIVKLEGLVTA